MATEMTTWLEQQARGLNLVAVGVARAEPIARAEAYREWLARGRAGSMDYMHRHAEMRVDPRKLLPGAKSIIVVADSYRQPRDLEARNDEAPSNEPRGRVARYAWGRDYHRVLKKKLHRLADALHEATEKPIETRVCVDTAPMIEREVAARAGIGWIGKNTLVLHPDLGSYFFLGEILTTLELAPSPPVTDHCGSCTQCLDACPTGAFPAPYEMDASRCISYLTIEHRHDIDPELQAQMGDWVFGCDICQEVCPFNRKPPVTPEEAYLPSSRFPLAPKPTIETLLQLDEDTYDRALRGSAMRRATRDMLIRNAEIAAKNAGAT